MNPTTAKLLLVDDSAAMRMALRELMSSIGFETIDEASDGQVAIEQFRKAHYDLVVSDWNMPVRDGLELLRRIRQGAERSDTPVLLITGDASVQRTEAAREAGVSVLLEKPFSSKDLCARVLGLLASLPESRPGNSPATGP